ncbi:MAG: hypothetical protein J6P84_02245 [Alphaproteobacteria bacterium]|nr:hypothetical protein [Alphaproteobacteria bacterium]MBO7537108.1 hypothetical protein [Alphaproteobacteria bacterium]MBO7641846.1 hypothetical protein [Alphaproteobacteria bacterium]MCR4624306.1 hypothetical protein [Alphaproteobacteria bacterium]
MNEAKSKKAAPKAQEKDDNMKNTEIEKALAKNDEEWLKRMLLLVLIMIIALLGID